MQVVSAGRWREQQWNRSLHVADDYEYDVGILENPKLFRCEVSHVAIHVSCRHLLARQSWVRIQSHKFCVTGKQLGGPAGRLPFAHRMELIREADYILI